MRGIHGFVIVGGTFTGTTGTFGQGGWVCFDPPPFLLRGVSDVRRADVRVVTTRERSRKKSSYSPHAPLYKGRMCKEMNGKTG